MSSSFKQQAVKPISGATQRDSVHMGKEGFSEQDLNSKAIGRKISSQEW